MNLCCVVCAYCLRMYYEYYGARANVRCLYFAFDGEGMCICVRNDEKCEFMYPYELDVSSMRDFVVMQMFE